MKCKILILLYIIFISVIPIVATAQLAESDHPYANYFDYTWPDITELGASQMRLHFTKIELPAGTDEDYLELLDKDGNVLTTYSDYYGFSKQDFWSDWYAVDTLKVRLKTNNQKPAWGFQIDKKETRTSMAPSSPMPESYHPYANYFDYTWPDITEPGASQMRLHFIKIELPAGTDEDYLELLDKDGNVLTTYSDYYGFSKQDFWSDWYAVDTLKVRLKTNNQKPAWGFQIDQKEIRAGMPAPTPILTPIITPTQIITPPSTNTPTPDYTNAPPPISTPRFTPIQTLTPSPQDSFETETTNTPTNVPPISTPIIAPRGSTNVRVTRQQSVSVELVGKFY